MIGVWCLGGFLTGFAERRGRVLPTFAAPDDSGLKHHLCLWGLLVPISTLTVALVLVMMITRWGEDIYAKPSIPFWILFCCGAILLPVGCLIGAVRHVLGRPLHPGGPVILAAAVPCLFVSFLVAASIEEWIIDDLLQLPTVTEAGTVLLLLTFAVFAVELSESRSVREFLTRWAALTALCFFAVVNFHSLSGSLPLSIAEKRAHAKASSGDHFGSAKLWLWYLTRSGPQGRTPFAVEAAAREALLAGADSLAARALSLVDEVTQFEFQADHLRPLRDSLDGVTPDPLDVLDVPVEPVMYEDYMNLSWSALLTAVRTARPELAENDMKATLRTISSSADVIDLPFANPFNLLQLVAYIFDCSVVLVPFEEKQVLLEQGLPVLFVEPSNQSWNLLYWFAPEVDALISLDYERWNDDLDRLRTSEVIGARSEITQHLISPSESAKSGLQRSGGAKEGHAVRFCFGEGRAGSTGERSCRHGATTHHFRGRSNGAGSEGCEAGCPCLRARPPGRPPSVRRALQSPRSRVA